jgi:diguanylate cyclase (GGDEF)-like protein/PAS domain S-box-containing protein
MVGLAALICLVTSYVAVTLMKRASTASSIARWLWLGTAGAAGGFGIWGTHFIAMLAYDPGVVMGYDPAWTFLSLAIAVAATMAAVSSAVIVDGRLGQILAGMFFGLGVASMHFTGMFAIEFPGTIIWDTGFVWTSLIVGTALSIASFSLATRVGNGLLAALIPAGLMTASVTAMHFIAMAAVTVTPGPDVVDTSRYLTHDVMAVMIAAVTFSLLSSGFSAAMFAIRAEHKTIASEKSFKLLVQGVTDYAIYMLDLEGRVTNWNAGAERAAGYTADEIVGQHFSVFHSQSDLDQGLPQKALETARTLGKFEAQGWRYRKDGSTFWANILIESVHDENGSIIGYAEIIRDITQHKIDTDKLAEASRNITEVSRNLDIALENMTQAICLFDSDEQLVVANMHYSEIFNFPKGFVRPGMSYWEIVEGGYRLNLKDPEIYLEKARQHYERNIALVRTGGGKYVQTYSSGKSLQHICHRMADGGWVMTFEDITERLRTDEHISFMATHDALTGLPNRRQFSAYLAEEIMVAERTGTKLAVIGIDLDKFKEINDQHGHGAGDTVLIQLAKRMSACLQGEELVARFGGDEFAAVKRFEDMAELHDFVDRIEKCLFDHANIDGFDVKTGASLGIALYPQDAMAVEQLVANADMAMYRAKQSLVQRVCFYEVAMDEVARDRRSLANDLWAATDNGEMHLHYQIQKSVASGLTTGYEVLLRWQHPRRGNIPPMDFIPLAEECGAILPIGEWVLREACREASKWERPDKIAVNLSPVQLGHADMAAVVLEVLLETGLDPHRLEIEITESSIITDKSRALQTLRQIKNLGVSIAIDDFGTGYSSLETLRAFPFDKIKLDKSFMSEVETSPQAKAIVRAILALGQSLDVPVLAEGVETQAQLDILFEEKCDEAQGYLLGRPIPLGTVLANNNVAPAIRRA